jgi:cell wall-associated NlpC family hydrolase
MRVCLALSIIGITLISCAATRNTSSAVSVNVRNGLVDYATSLIGTRYKYGGTSPGSGFDCSGFTSYVMKKYGYTVPRSSRDQAKNGRTIRIDDVEPGDLVFFGKGNRIDHVAIVVKSTRKCLEIVHSSSSHGVIMEDVMKSRYWTNRLLCAVDLSSL